MSCTLKLTSVVPPISTGEIMSDVKTKSGNRLVRSAALALGRGSIILEALEGPPPHKVIAEQVGRWTNREES